MGETRVHTNSRGDSPDTDYVLPACPTDEAYRLGQATTETRLLCRRLSHRLGIAVRDIRRALTDRSRQSKSFVRGPSLSIKQPLKAGLSLAALGQRNAQRPEFCGKGRRGSLCTRTFRHMRPCHCDTLHQSQTGHQVATGIGCTGAPVWI